MSETLLIIPEEKWRIPILNSLHHLFTDNNNFLYGIKHAIEVERRVLALLSEQELRDNPIDPVILCSAALLHDVGCASHTNTWSTLSYEHILHGEELARSILKQIEYFQNDPIKIQQVLALIRQHDETLFRYPSLRLQGTLITYPNLLGSVVSWGALSLLKEADAFVHLNESSIDTIIQEWVSEGVPIIPRRARALNVWSWMHSVVSNLRLLARRLLIDAYTPAGKLKAETIYHSVERRIEELCQINEYPYEPELFHPQLREISVSRSRQQIFQIELKAYYNWPQLESALREVRLSGDPTIIPYRNAHIKSKVWSLSQINPMALYVLEERLQETLELYDALMIAYGINLFDLPSLLEFSYNGMDAQVIAAPVIEQYEETDSLPRRVVAGLVDGLHRCQVARDLGLTHIRAITVSGVPFPLVPLPASWHEVITYNEIPPKDKKRHYRYPYIEVFRSKHPDLADKVTEATFQYYFYRKLEMLGSKGQRTFDEFDQ